jgi:transposase, IS5 family
VFGYKNHASIDRAHGFMRCFVVMNAAAHDGARLPDVLDKTNTASAVWADTAYRSQANETHMKRNGLYKGGHPERSIR